MAPLLLATVRSPPAAGNPLLTGKTVRDPTACAARPMRVVAGLGPTHGRACAAPSCRAHGGSMMPERPWSCSLQAQQALQSSLLSCTDPGWRVLPHSAALHSVLRVQNATPPDSEGCSHHSVPSSHTSPQVSLVHPVIMFGLLGVSVYTGILGWKLPPHRTLTPVRGAPNLRKETAHEAHTEPTADCPRAALPQHGVVRLLGLPRLLLCCMARCCHNALWRSRAARQQPSRRRMTSSPTCISPWPTGALRVSSPPRS